MHAAEPVKRHGSGGEAGALQDIGNVVGFDGGESCAVKMGQYQIGDRLKHGVIVAAPAADLFQRNVRRIDRGFGLQFQCANAEIGSEELLGIGVAVRARRRRRKKG